MESSYPASYDGYQQWQADEQTQYQNVLNDQTLAESHPMAYILAVLYSAYHATLGYQGWSAEAMTGATDISNPVQSLQAYFTDPSSFSASQQTTILNNIDTLYNKLGTVSGTDNPFSSLASTVQTQLQTIMPSEWGFPSSSVTNAQLDSVNSWFESVWSASAGGDSSELNGIKTAFSTIDSATGGVTNMFKEKNQAASSDAQEILGSVHTTTSSIVGLESQSVNNEIPS